MLYLIIVTIIAIVITIIGGALLSVAEIHDCLKPFAYTVLAVGGYTSFLLGIVWLIKL